MEKAIYKITNKINGHIYIGQSNDPERRWSEHKYRNEHYYSLIHSAIVKYGEENFIFEIIEWCENYNEREIYWINYYKSLAPYGYNISQGGNEPPRHCGEENSQAKITQEVADKIKKQLQDWRIPRKTIIKSNKVTSDIVRHINEGSSWYDENLNYPLRISEKELNKMRADKVKELLISTSLNQKEIGRQVGWNRSAVTMINIGKNYFDSDLDYPIRKENNSWSKIEKIDKDGVVLGSFLSITEAARENGCAAITISKAIANHTKAFGFYWRYKQK